MIKNFMWDYFEKTGDVSAFLNYKDFTKKDNVIKNDNIAENSL